MKSFLPLFILLLLLSCNRNKIDERTFTKNNIEISWYKISEITTTHDFITLTRSGHTKNIMEANTGGIYNISITEDTITIQTLHSLVIYELAEKSLGCYIKLDSSITDYEYQKKYMPKSADAFKEQKVSTSTNN